MKRIIFAPFGEGILYSRRHFGIDGSTDKSDFLQAMKRMREHLLRYVSHLTVQRVEAHCAVLMSGSRLPAWDNRFDGMQHMFCGQVITLGHNHFGSLGWVRRCPRLRPEELRGLRGLRAKRLKHTDLAQKSSFQILK